MASEKLYKVSSRVGKTTKMKSEEEVFSTGNDFEHQSHDVYMQPPIGLIESLISCSNMMKLFPFALVFGRKLYLIQ